LLILSIEIEILLFIFYILLMTGIAAMEDVKMNETQDSATVTEVSKVASSGDGDVAMGDGGDHEKMVKAAKQSELSRLPYLPILTFFSS
jgi:hypothetical protein